DGDLLAVDDQHVVGFLVRSRLLGSDLAAELLLRRIVLEEVGQVVGRHDVADRDDLDVLAEQPLLVQGAKEEAADPPETVDRDTSAHFNLRFLLMFAGAALYMTRPTAPSNPGAPLNAARGDAATPASRRPRRRPGAPTRMRCRRRPQPPRWRANPRRRD